MRFEAKRPTFGQQTRADEPDQANGLPAPKMVKLAARRLAGIKEASEVLALLPGPGESLHALATARMDLTDVVNCLLERLGTCDRLSIATLGYNPKNLRQILGWFDAGQVKAMTLLASIFYRSHNGEKWAQTIDAFRQRKQRAAAAHSHAKVITLAFADGAKLVIEGSSNLCGNGSGREQFALINHAGLHDWHERWIQELVSKSEGKDDATQATKADA